MTSGGEGGTTVMSTSSSSGLRATRIVELLLRRIRESMAERELQLDLTEKAKDLLVEKGWDPAMGARPLRRAIQHYVEDPLADFVLRAELAPGSTVLVDEGEGEKAEPEVKLTVIAPEKKPEPVGVGAKTGDDDSGDEAAGDDSGEDSA